MKNIGDIRTEAVHIADADTSRRIIVLRLCAGMIMKLKRHEHSCRCEYCSTLDTYIMFKKNKSRFFRRYAEVDEWYSSEQIMQARKDFETLRNEVRKLRAQKEGLKRKAAAEMLT